MLFTDAYTLISLLNFLFIYYYYAYIFLRNSSIIGINKYFIYVNEWNKLIKDMFLLCVCVFFFFDSMFLLSFKIQTNSDCF